MQNAELVKRMKKEAIEEMLHYHELGMGEKVKNSIKKAAGRYAPPKDFIFWPTGLLANTLAKYYNEWEDKEDVLHALKTYFDRWIDKGMPIYYMDDTLCGTALLDVYQITGEDKYKAAADKMAEYLHHMAETESDKTGSVPYRSGQKNNHIYVDGIGMACPFLCRYGITFKHKESIEIAVTQIKNMLKYGMCEETHFPYHGFEYESRVKYGIIGWGRAIGWLLMGMAGVLRFLPENHADYVEIKEEFVKLLDKVLLKQKNSGAFSWQLEALEGPEDSSATGMIIQSVLMGIDNGILEKVKYKKAVERAATFIRQQEHNGQIYQCSGECLGFSQYPQYYHAYPWSLGPGIGVLMGEEKCWKGQS